MSFRSNHTIQTRVENKRFSYRQVRRKSQKQITSQSSSQSQTSHEAYKDNFNSGHNLKNIHVSSNSKSQQSQNQTQSFIRAQFKPSLSKKVEDFKLFSKEIQKSKRQKEIIDNFYDEKNKENRKRKETYNTAYFQISVEDEPINYNVKNPIKSSRIQFQIPAPQISVGQMQSQTRQKQKKFHFFQELQFLQKTIMKTLKQKQRHVEILVKQVENLYDQKIHNFKMNQQLQVQLQQLRKKSDQNLIENLNWRPKNVQQMKLQIQSQKLSEELKRLQDQQFVLKEIQSQLKEQEIVLKQSLKSTLKARKQYAKCLVKPRNGSKQQQIENSQINNKKYYDSRVIPINRQKSTKLRRAQSKKENRNLINYSIKQSESKIQPTQNQLNQLQEKQLLIQLLNDFNELKCKVDQSLIHKHKSKSIATKNHSTNKKNQKIGINLKK